MKGVWVDVGCEDFKAAARNRRMVRLKQKISGYLFIEAVIRGWPHRKPLPEWLYGSIPTIHRYEYEDRNEDRYLHSLGMHRIERGE